MERSPAAHNAGRGILLSAVCLVLASTAGNAQTNGGGGVELTFGAEQRLEVTDNLGLDVIAEGVEREEQLEFLRDLGVKEAQRFFFNKAMPLEEAMSLLADKRSSGS